MRVFWGGARSAGSIRLWSRPDGRCRSVGGSHGESDRAAKEEEACEPDHAKGWVVNVMQTRQAKSRLVWPSAPDKPTAETGSCVAVVLLSISSVRRLRANERKPHSAIKSGTVFLVSFLSFFSSVRGSLLTLGVSCRAVLGSVNDGEGFAEN